MSQAGIAGMRQAAQDIFDVVETFDAADWHAPSAANGWSAKDVVTHVGSLLEDLVAAVSQQPLPDMGIEALNDLQVTERRHLSGPEAIAFVKEQLGSALDAFEPLQVEPVASSEVPMLDLGSYPLHAIADMFTFDMATHLRYDILAPRGPIVRHVAALDEVVLAPSVAWLLGGIPKMQPTLATAVDGPLALELTGPGGRDVVVDVTDGVVTVVSAADAGIDPIATISSTTADFLAWSTRRTDWRNAATIAGDHAAAQHFLDTLNLI
ncbi:maleylpyruvate isomerase N-terminal domain-containing protein [Mycolicibacterium sp. P1-18]|uniref:maleylpyruvate isomerase N-terminal domain-containing protein n=1 Tax=Mycolicibacterium sp. P1-18 TaxID=2024615 RepID=UPI00156398F8|nr:maleylpyruvate isomerase N-terminal domain-containing protein [Mycolicibacterium sp. P1-18]